MYSRSGVFTAPAAALEREFMCVWCARANAPFAGGGSD